MQEREVRAPSDDSKRAGCWSSVLSNGMGSILVCTGRMDWDSGRSDRCRVCVSGERAVTDSKCRSIDASDQVSNNQRCDRWGDREDRETMFGALRTGWKRTSSRLVPGTRVE